MEEHHSTEQILSNPVAFVRLRGERVPITVRADRIIMMRPHSNRLTTIWVDLGDGHGYSVKQLVQENEEEIIQKIEEALA